MGNGIGSYDHEKKSEIINYLSEKYEGYKHCNDYDNHDDEIKIKLINDYMRLEESYKVAEEIKAEELIIKSSSITTKQLEDSKASKLYTITKRVSLNDKLKDSNKTNQNTRRKSFDYKPTINNNSKNNGVHTKQHLPSSMKNKHHDIVILNNNVKIHDGMDHWDSVATQPYCDICTMAFKTDAYLDRHIKYSDVHQQNKVKKDKNDAIKKHQQGQIKVDDMVPITVVVVADDMTMTTYTQVEGIDYKLIYNGRKLFWRTREEVDISIYIHLKLSILEIISHDLQRNKEYKRIYMNHVILQDLLQSNMKSKMTVIDGYDEDKALSRYLISRVQLITVDDDKSIQFVPSQTDPISDSVIIDKLPIHFMGVSSITRRRRSNGDEIDAMICVLEADRVALCKATLKAQNISRVVTASAMFMASRKWWANFNPIRKKWIWAIRKVIRRRLVAETLNYLLKLRRKEIQRTAPYLHAAIDREARRSFDAATTVYA